MSRDEETKKRPSLTLHMVSSLDGFIAKKDNDIS
jgi:riboflavin biosynthesis pyrimidine reductase